MLLMMVLLPVCWCVWVSGCCASGIGGSQWFEDNPANCSTVATTGNCNPPLDFASSPLPSDRNQATLPPVRTSKGTHKANVVDSMRSPTQILEPTTGTLVLPSNSSLAVLLLTQSNQLRTTTSMATKTTTAGRLHEVHSWTGREARSRGVTEPRKHSERASLLVVLCLLALLASGPGWRSQPGSSTQQAVVFAWQAGKQAGPTTPDEGQKFCEWDFWSAGAHLNGRRGQRCRTGPATGATAALLQKTSHE